MGSKWPCLGLPARWGWVISHPCCLRRGAGQWRRETRSPLQVKAAKCISIEMEGGGPNQHQAQEQAPFPNPTQREGELSLCVITYSKCTCVYMPRAANMLHFCLSAARPSLVLLLFLPAWHLLALDKPAALLMSCSVSLRSCAPSERRDSPGSHA